MYQAIDADAPRRMYAELLQTRHQERLAHRLMRIGRSTGDKRSGTPRRRVSRVVRQTFATN